MIDRNTKARAIAELATAIAESVSDVAGHLSNAAGSKVPTTRSDSSNNVNFQVGAMMHAESELTKVLELIRAAKALNQMSVAE